ncbi:MAG: membrane protein insertion efficiency factor YidD [Planctomycetota bacterium]
MDSAAHSASPAPPQRGWRYWSTLPLIIPIRCYQMTLARIMPPICRFEPSCSHYTVEALQKRGAIRGLFLGTWRILRCNPFCRGGYDPVPEPRSRPDLPA